MKILVVTNDPQKFRRMKESSEDDLMGCFRVDNFKKMLNDNQPRVILSDRKCRKVNKRGEEKPCFFDPDRELRGTAVSTPVFPIKGWCLWLKIVKIYDKVMPPGPN